MRTKNKKPAEVGNLPGFRKSPEESAKEEIKDSQEATPANPKERFQISFDLNDDGSPDLSAMRGRTKERVQAFFSDPKMAQAFGVKAPLQPEVQVFHPAMVGGLYAMLGSIEALAVSRMSKIPEPICKRVFTYTPQEVELLTPPTVRVLNKYAAEWMIKYQDEIALATLLTSITITKFNVATMMAKQMDQANTVQTPSQAKNEENGKKEGSGTEPPIQ